MFPVLLAMAAGMGSGYLLRNRKGLFRLLEPATAWVIRLLLFLLGLGIGSDSELVARIPELGLKGLVLALAGILGSVGAARILVGRPEKTEGLESAVPVESESAGFSGQNSQGLRQAVRGSLAAVLAFGLGLGAGFLPAAGFAGGTDLSSPVLYLLMFLVGSGAGADPTAVTMIRRYGGRLILLPVAVVIGTAIGTLAVAMLWPALPIRESLAVGAGYGYYSLSSLIIRELSGGDWAAVALLSNISREILTLLIAPVLVRVAGPTAVPAAGGATSMDTTLAATVQTSGRAWAVPALFSGVILTILVPFIVTLILSA